jgi:hypothetical protein
MRLKVFFVGGYFNESMYGWIEQSLLPDEILMHHYENPKATMQGVTILGITQKGPDDITVVERYVKVNEDEVMGMAFYKFEGTVDPSKVVKIEDLDGETVLKMKDEQ